VLWWIVATTRLLLQGEGGCKMVDGIGDANNKGSGVRDE